MSLLNITNDGLPNVLVVLHAAVLRSTKPIPKDELLESVAPAHFVSDAGAMARFTLNSWLTIGLFQEVNGAITSERYPHPIRNASPIDVLAFTRRSACRAALSESANADLWGTRGAGDLTRALSWSMTQDVYRTGFSQFEALEAEQISDPDRQLFRNLTRKTGLQYWARFLGFSREPYADIDPTVALRDALPEIMNPEEKLTADAFLDRVAAALPVLDRGRWQLEVLASMDRQQPYVRQQGQLSPALSRALLNLRATNELQLQRTSDSGTSMVLTGSQGARLDLTFQEIFRTKGTV